VRIVFLTHNFPRTPDDVSGAFLATLARALIERGHDVRVVAPSDRGKTGAPTLEGIPVRRVRYAAPEREVLAYRGTMAEAIRSLSGVRALAGLWRSLRHAARDEVRAGADLVHAHWWVPGGLAAPPGVPLVLTSHGTDAALLERSALARAVAGPLYRRATVVTAVSTAAAGWIGSAVRRSVDHAHISPMPVDVGRFTGWSEGGGGAVVLGRLAPQKRVHLAIEAIAGMAREGRTTRLTIIGAGPELPRLEGLAQSLGISSQVTFAGAIAPGEVFAALSRADVLLFPAEREGFGLAAAEALMSGVPVVACEDGGGALDVVPRAGAGRIVAPTAPALAEAASAVLDDPSRFTAARAAGEAWRKRLAPSHVAEICERWYLEALDA
jgi:glycosyltransferase involved in cell wall biosynthesis